MGGVLLFFALVAGSYLLGSIPWGYLLGRLAGKDIRLEGSKNIGATNLWRVCGWKYGLLCFFLDFGKGLAAVYFTAGFGDAFMLIFSFCAVLGHNFPVWLGFKGGKGVATSAGVVAALMPLSFCIAIGVFILTVAVFRYISLGSMVASVALVAATWWLAPQWFIVSCCLSALIILRHRANIRRILAGTENRFPPPRKS